MNDSFKLLELDFCRVKNHLNTLSGNVYSNPPLEEYQKKLFSIFEQIESEFKTKSSALSESPERLIGITKVLKAITMSVQFLEDSILNVIPYETVFCLERALYDWTDDKYTFVTSLKKDYYFDDSLSLDDRLFTLIKTLTGVEFHNKLIQIGIPKHEVNDYFQNVVLYHELGHFIDLKYGISDAIVYQEFPTLGQSDMDLKINHYREYFSDVFAAQYVDRNVLRYLEYEAPFDGDSDTHPSTENRKDVINDFLSSTSNEVLDHLIQSTKAATGKELKIRYSSISDQDFFDFIPPVINNNEQLHGLFVVGWDLWISKRDKFKNTDSFKIYTYINNLIEKSISNYMVETQWVDAKKAREDVSK